LATLRIYLTGRISVEHAQSVIDERDLSGRQGRLALAFLASERHRPVSKDQLVEVIWPDEAPREVDIALSAILSKLRGLLKRTSPSAAIEVLSGTVQFRLPPDAWVDIEHAANAMEEADGAIRAGNRHVAWGHAVTLVIITRRPFLPGEDAPWIERRRGRLRAMLVRGLSALSQISAANDEHALAVQYATEVLEVEPFQESGYRQLMRLHAGMGNRAEALRVFGRCRELLREELGAAPSQETEAAFLEILRA
jgi:DNA-binding SARP family transcriptional activator